jgi:hypothetical protein
VTFGAAFAFGLGLEGPAAAGEAVRSSSSESEREESDESLPFPLVFFSFLTFFESAFFALPFPFAGGEESSRVRACTEGLPFLPKEALRAELAFLCKRRKSQYMMAAERRK